MGEVLVVDVDVKIIRETERAFLVDDSKVETWIPKSQIEDVDTFEVGEETTITIPEWLAEENGLI